jgi:replication factor C large subunit
MPLAEKYKPKNLAEFVDQREALEQFLEWIKKWRPGSKALLFYGNPGTGKTALVHAYAKEKNLEFIEMNASDWRSASQIEEVLGQSMKQMSLFKKGKIFLIDECDNLAGREDMGGVGAMIKIIKESMFPVVLTSNNPYDPKLRNLRQYCQLVEFRKIPVWDIEARLMKICEAEKIKCDKNVLSQIAKMSGGDLRSALNDLEAAAEGKNEITVDDLEALGQREREVSIFDALKTIFRTKTALAAKVAIEQVDKDPEEIFWWIENNISREYENPEEIAKAFDALSKADIFRQRIALRQKWQFKAYMIDLMTAGIAVAKRKMYSKFTRYQYPSNIMILGRTKGARAEKKKVLAKLAENLHCSTRKVRKEYLPYVKIMLKDPKNRKIISDNFQITGEELKSLFY